MNLSSNSFVDHFTFRIMFHTRWGLAIHLIFICTISVLVLSDKCVVDARNNLTATCSKQERLALLKFKNSVKDNHGLLSSWVGNDCCQWERVTCDYATGNVVALHLHKVTQPSYNDMVGTAYRGLGEEMIGDDYQSAGDQSFGTDHRLVSNKVNSCLEKLRHLKYLDLSGNDFQGSRIPDFIGSFNYLSYLNLSDAGFGGIIPSRIGNLSYLKVLDLSSFFPYPNLMANNMAWVSGLSSLEHLSLDEVDLSGAQNLDRLLYRIPLLSQLSLRGCNLYDARLGSHLNSSSKLASIRHLDLSWNSYQGQLPVILQNMTSLAFLDLSGFNFSLVWNSANLLNMFPSLPVLRLSDCGLQNINLSPTRYNFSTRSNIQHLDLSHNYIFGEFPIVLANMTSLLSLDLSSNYLNSSIPVMPNLLKLDLSQNILERIEHVGIWRHCHMKELIVSHNVIDKEEMVVPSTNVSECSQYALERLNIGHNLLNGSIPETLGKLTSLRGLDLSFNDLTGPLPEALGKLRSLQVLDLSFNGLTGPIPQTLEILTSLQVLDVSSNHLIGRIPKFHGQLTKLRLAHNQFNGSIPESLGSFTDLTQLLLQSNRLTGTIPISLKRLVSLQKFSVSSNFLGGTIPFSVGQLTRLDYLDLSNNSFQGMVSEAHFSNLTELKYLNLDYNENLAFNTSREWIPLFQLRILRLRSCKISDEFPQWFRTQRNLEELALSNANISGPLPAWFQKMRIIRVIDLSHNNLTGSLINLPSREGFEQVGLDSRGGILLLQNNLFSGSIPTSLCARKDLSVLDLSRNRLTAEIPKCLSNIEFLTMILFSSNMLSGNISSFLGRLPPLLVWLQLNDNNFTGELSQELSYLRDLTVLDLGENKISGTIPEWIGNNLTQLHILRLHKNNFTGRVPQSLCSASFLKILDLAHNSLTGSIPCCFGDFFGMSSPPWSEDTLSYWNINGNVLQVIKGVDLEYAKTLNVVINMDLSSNKLTGEIPEELTALISLVGLNLSNNHLNGGIPYNIGNMKALISLDLSANHLTGTIPPSMSDLNFLTRLNLSRNSLSGQIPTGNQLQTLTDPSIYADNRDLCGAPLPKNCSNHAGRTSATSMAKYRGANNPKKVWFYLDIMSGFATGFWGIIGVLLFKRQWRHKLFMYSEATLVKIQVAAAVRISKMTRGKIAG